MPKKRRFPSGCSGGDQRGAACGSCHCCCRTNREEQAQEAKVAAGVPLQPSDVRSASTLFLCTYMFVEAHAMLTHPAALKVCDSTAGSVFTTSIEFLSEWSGATSLCLLPVTHLRRAWWVAGNMWDRKTHWKPDTFAAAFRISIWCKAPTLL